MTMVPAQNLNLSKRDHHLLKGGGGFYGSCGGGGGYGQSFGVMSSLNGYDIDELYQGEAGVGTSDLAATPMAEDESTQSRTNSFNEAGSSSKDNNNNNQEERDHDEGWLQLSIGAQARSHIETKHDIDIQAADPTVIRRGGLVELDLLPGGGSSSSSQQQAIRPFMGPNIFHHVPEFRSPAVRPVLHSFSTSNNLFLQQQQQGSNSSALGHQYHHQEISWAFRPISQHIASSSSSSSSSLIPLGPYMARPLFQMQSGLMDVAGPSSDVRIIDPPRRPHSGIWFMLQASQNQAKEPFLPQIPKSYLRIKDGRMTVRLLMKYLVNKLRLDSESEIEITCRGQQLQPFLTLQHVRDNIWISSREAVTTLLPDSSSSPSSSSSLSTADHVMVLQYGRSASE